MGHVRDLPKKKLGVDVKKGFDRRVRGPGHPQEGPRRAEGGGEGRGHHLPRGRPRPRGRGHLLAPGRRARHQVQEEGPPRRLQRDHEARDRGRLQEPRRHRREEGRRAAGAAHPRSAGRVQGEPHPLGQGPARAVGRAACSRWPCADLRPRARDPRLRARGVLVGRSRTSQPPQPPVFPANLVKQDGKNVEIVQRRAGRHRARATWRRRPSGSRRSQPEERKRNPVPPFITSKLQQEAFKKLRFSVKKTMQVAQRLYEGVELGPDGSVGLITYMRTDSTRVSNDALEAVREPHRGHLRRGLPPREAELLQSKKDAQDAHEAIRPTLHGARPRVHQEVPGQGRAGALQADLEPLRRLADAPAVYDETVVDIEAAAYLLRAKGSTMRFQRLPRGLRGVARREAPGEGRRRAQPAPRSPRPRRLRPLPPLAEGDVLKLGSSTPTSTSPSRRRASREASLVKELEENGIGRPSTYASIIATIEAREYMEKREGKLYPTELGFLVTDLLVEHFQDIMNVEYTAAMERELDEIEEGTDNLLNTLNQFWKKFEEGPEEGPEGDGERQGHGGRRPTRSATSAASRWSSSGAATASSSPAQGYPECKNTRQLAGGEGTDAPELHEDVAKEVCSNDEQPMVLKKGRFGPFLACTNYPECKVTKRLVRGEGGKLQVESCPHRREVPRVHQGPHVAPRPLRRLHRLQQLSRAASTSRRRKRARSASPAPSADRARWSSARAAGAGSSTAAAAIPSAVHRVPQAHRRALSRLRPRLSCWRRRRRRKARSSSAATRPATTSATRPDRAMTAR